MTVVDTVSVPVADTLVLPDTSDVLVVPDTALVRGDPAADSVPAVETFHRIPDLEGGPPPGFATGVWVFEREDILGSRAVSLAELVGTVPGVIPLRGGDFGTPRTVTAFGLAGGGIRIFWDGMEMLPLDGGVTDLSHVGLGGVERVRVERHAGELRIDLTSLRNFDPRPYTLVEAGTGDLSTNLFRGTFVHPRALGGSLGLTMDRLDTRGSRGAETGVQQGTWLRYTWHGDERWAVTGELRRMKAETEVPAFPATSTRTDWVVRVRGSLTPDLVAEAFTGESDLEADVDPAVDDAGAVRRERRQHGLHAAWTPGPVWIRGALRLLGGHDVPSSALELSGGGHLGGVGGAGASLSRESWEGEAATLLGLQAWTTPLFGLSGFATWTSGGRGVRVDTLAVPPEPDPGEGEEGEGEEEPPEPETPRPTHRLTDRSALRVGAVWRWRGAELSGAALALETDSLPPLGTPL
ncbi:MAG: TonB-dependent receptor plug domain-containing protein, partial [Gemmatimonadetes bacterium]|nr:TonB-dependent receptor plug domain-containing protein [Gemmatimonadota bacterium]